MISSPSWNLKHWPDKALSTECLEGPVPDGLIEEMKAVIFTHDGYGLACSQLGVTDCRVFIMRDTDKKGEILVFQNPVIVERDTRTIEDYEGCLSVPGERLKISRFRAVDIEFDAPVSQFEKPILIGDERLTWHFEAMNARCCQHEIDHLNGIMIFDHIKSNLGRRVFIEKYYKRKKRHARIG